ncbi:hypothetical protein T484DRAFT_3056397 [Baffinella frigidus]|nr:hypothetical protein T484DRAFT_3056397 [Cryptophyta sp. CCMP2293]
MSTYTRHARYTHCREGIASTRIRVTSATYTAGKESRPLQHESRPLGKASRPLQMYLYAQGKVQHEVRPLQNCRAGIASTRTRVASATHTVGKESRPLEYESRPLHTL